MRAFGAGLTAVMIAVVIQIFLHTETAHAACDRKGSTKAKTVVYQDVPRFSTGQGWKLAPQVGTIPSGAVIQICEERWVGFFYDKKVWLQIRFVSGDKEQQGWIRGDSISGKLDDPGWKVPLFWTAVAYAQDESDTGVPSNFPFYLFVFIAVIIGMAAKGLFDQLEHNKLNWHAYLIRTVPAFLVSPIVILTFLNTGNFAFGDNGFLIFLCMAFQNGFFWQTVLVRAKGLKAQG